MYLCVCVWCGRQRKRICACVFWVFCMCVWNLVICGSLSLVTFEAKLSCQSHCCRGTEDVTGTMAAVCVCVCAYIMYALLCICITRATVCMCVWGNMLPGRVTLRGWGPSEQFLSSSSPVDTGSVAVIAKCCCCSRCVGTAHMSWKLMYISWSCYMCSGCVCVCLFSINLLLYVRSHGDTVYSAFSTIHPPLSFS